VSTAHADRLGGTRVIARGDYLAPRWDPTERELLVTGLQMRGLYVMPIDGSAAPRQLTDDAEAGVFARWTPAGTVAYRAPRAGMRRDLAVDRLGRVQIAPPVPPIAFAQDDRMYVQGKQGLVEIGSGDRFFGAVVSPDGDRVAFQGLVTGLYVYTRSTATLAHVGPGTAPAWSRDGKRIVFEVTEDDGHDIVASDLYLYDVATDHVSQLTNTEQIIERRPSFSPSGTRIAYDDNAGGVFVGTLEAK
jgi:dipeptidyl aminopeptidase/acylaminoacyl peptidase